MSRSFDTPRQALAAMHRAGAEFKVHPRADGLPENFTYSVRPGGDRVRCREVLAEVKSRPTQFFAAFRVMVAEIAKRGAA